MRLLSTDLLTKYDFLLGRHPADQVRNDAGLDVVFDAKVYRSQVCEAELARFQEEYPGPAATTLGGSARSGEAAYLSHSENGRHLFSVF